jgi:hypothetical protein
MIDFWDKTVKTVPDNGYWGWAVLLCALSVFPAWWLYLRRSNRRSGAKLGAALGMSKSLSSYPLTQEDLDWLEWAAEGEGSTAVWAQGLWASLKAWSPKDRPVVGQIVDLTPIMGRHAA